MLLLKKKDVSQVLKCKILVLCWENPSSVWEMVCSHEKHLWVRKPVLNFDAAPMSSVSVSPSVKWRQRCFSFSLRHPWGWCFGSAAEFPRVALYVGCWQCPRSCTVRRTRFALQRLQFSGMGNHVTRFAWGRAGPKPTPNACSKIFFISLQGDILLLFLFMPFSAPLQTMPTSAYRPFASLGIYLQIEPFAEAPCRDARTECPHYVLLSFCRAAFHFNIAKCSWLGTEVTALVRQAAHTALDAIVSHFLQR